MQLEQSRQQELQEMNQHRGSLGVVQQNTREAKKGLGDPRYHQIAERYRKQLVEVRTAPLRPACSSCKLPVGCKMAAAAHAGIG